MRQNVENNDIEFDIALVNFKGDQAIDIKNLLVEFNVYEDIFSPFLKADFLIKDGVGLTERFPIIGDEKILLSFKTAGEKKFISLTFSLYKITQRTMIEERSHGYVLHGISREGLTDQVSTEERAYTNEPFSDIVTKVYNNHLKKVANKKFVVEPTEGLFSFIAPGVNPSMIIQQVASEAQSAKYPSTSSFVFYEDVDQFNMRTISSMYDSDVVESFYLADPSDEKLRDNKESITSNQTIIALTFETGFDTLGGIMSGLYKNDVESIDTILKKYQATDFDYVRDFSKMTHVSDNPVLTTFGTIGAPDGGVQHTRYLSTRISTNDYKKTSYLDGKVTNANDPFLASPRRRQKFLNQSINEMQMFAQYSMSIAVPGNSLLRSGNLINVFIPQNSDINEDIQQYLKLFGQTNPTFIVSAIKHNYKATTGAYITTMNINKESFGQPIKSEYISKDVANEQ